MQFIVLSFKTEVRQKSIRDAIRRCPVSIFPGFVTALGGTEELLDDIVASLLEVGFSIDFKGLREYGPMRVNTSFLGPLVNNNSAIKDITISMELGNQRL